MNEVLEYLWHGYLPPRTIPEWLWRGVSEPVASMPYTPKGACSLLDHLFDGLCDKHRAPHCVPLSGGWDSRLILGALCERVDSKEIRTVTFGCPKQLDFEIGQGLARHLGIQHHILNLDDLKIEWADLVQSAREAPWTYVPDGYILSTLFRVAIGEAGASTIWSGFLGDPLTGGHARESLMDQPKVVRYKRFANGQRRVKGMQLTMAGFAPSYPDLPKCTNGPFIHNEWLDFGLRQRGCIAPIVLPGKSWSRWSAEQGAAAEGARFVAPYCDSKWGAYWLHAPRELHTSQHLYLEMANQKYPRLFSLPSKYSLGLSPKALTRQRVYRTWLRCRAFAHRWFPSFESRSGLLDKYVDFRMAFRKRDDWIVVVEKAISILEEREAAPWVPLQTIWNEHLRGKRDHSQALLVLLGLAVNLEAHS